MGYVDTCPQLAIPQLSSRLVWIIPKLIIPPMAVDPLLDVVLWSTYGETSAFLHERMNHPLAVSLISGGVAGGAQAVVAAPAENLRLRIENGAHSGWSAAWKDVFVGTHTNQVLSCENL